MMFPMPLRRAAVAAGLSLAVLAIGLPVAKAQTGESGVTAPGQLAPAALAAQLARLRAQVKALSPEDHKEFRAEMQALQGALRDNLTPEQRARLEERQGRMGDRGRPGHRPPLTQEQRAAWAERTAAWQALPPEVRQQRLEDARTLLETIPPEDLRALMGAVMRGDLN